MKLDIRAFALSCGLLWGLAVFLATSWILALDGAITESRFLGRIYRGYRVTPLGSIIGPVRGFVDGLIGGAIFAWPYNRLARGRRGIPDDASGQ